MSEGVLEGWCYAWGARTMPRLLGDLLRCVPDHRRRPQLPSRLPDRRNIAGGCWEAS